MTSTGTLQIEMPEMGESVSEGTVLEWHVAEGDSVAEGDTVVEVSTDKVDAEVPAPASGTIAKILKGEDEEVKVGEALAELAPGEVSGNGAGAPAAAPEQAAEELAAPGREAEEAAADLAAAPGREAEEAESIDVVMPEMGESVTEGTILEWHVAPGDSVAEGDTIVEVSTDKVDAEVPAPAAGTITELLKDEDDTVAVGEALARMEAGEGAAEAEAGERPAEAAP